MDAEGAEHKNAGLKEESPGPRVQHRGPRGVEAPAGECSGGAELVWGEGLWDSCPASATGIPVLLLPQGLDASATEIPVLPLPQRFLSHLCHSGIKSLWIGWNDGMDGMDEIPIPPLPLWD